MIIYKTDNGTAEVEVMGKDFYVVTLRPQRGRDREIYVSALFSAEAAARAYFFWYRRETQISRI